MKIIEEIDFFKKTDWMRPTSEEQIVVISSADAAADGAGSNGSAVTAEDIPLNYHSTSCIPGMIGDSCSEFLYQDIRGKWLINWPYLDSGALKQRQVIAAAALRRFNAKSIFEVGGYSNPVIDFISHDLHSFVGVDPLIRPEWRSNVEGTADCLKCTIKEVWLLPCLLQDVRFQKFDMGVRLDFDAVVVLGYEGLFGMQGEDRLHLLSVSSASILVLEASMDWPSSQAAGAALISTLVEIDWQIQMDILLDVKQSPDLEAYKNDVFRRRRLVTLQRITVPP
jgi:hypothetical protein